MTIEELRQETRRRLGACPTCGRGVSTADAADIGLPYHTLRRWLKGDGVDQAAMDKLASWLERRLRDER